MSKITLTLALVAATFAAPVVAQQRSVEVVYSDLNLNTSAGIAAFDRRINAAVGQACGQPVNLGQHNAVRNCRAGAYAQAMSQRSLILARAQTGNSPLRIAAAR